MILKYTKLLLDAIVCPQCKSQLKLSIDENLFRCSNCDKNYYIKNGIAVLMEERKIYVSGKDMNVSKITMKDMGFSSEITPEDWDTVKWESEDDRATRRMRKVLEYLPNDGLHLDIGTGRGDGTALVGVKKKTIGIEYGHKSAVISSKKYIDIVQGDAAELPFPDKYFKSITCLDVLEHILEPEKALREMFRVLDDKGILVLQTPSRETHKIKNIGRYLYYIQLNITHPINFMRKLFQRIFGLSILSSKVSPPQPIEIYRPKRQIIEMIQEAGFEVTYYRKIRYWNQYRIIWMFSFSDLFILKKVSHWRS